MGSLPNLHELGKESACGAFKPTTALGHLCSEQGGWVLSEHERNKILHRHNKVGKTRSYGCEPNKIIVDDSTLEHMAGYSPISNRSVRQFHQIRRKDSLSSSIGATSVRRLLAVVRNGPSHRQRAHRTSEPSKHSLVVNVVLLCVSHLTITATYLPYLALQSSLSVWSMPDHLVPLDINVGSLFLGLSHVLASLVCLVTLPFNQRFGGNIILAVSYLLLTVHFIINLHPVLYLMIPSSIVFGIALGLMVNAQVTCLMTIAIKLSNVYRMVDEDEEMKNIRYTCLIRRTARAFRGAHDFGLIFGSIASTLIISWTIGNVNLSTDVSTNTTELICLQTSFVNSTSNCTTTLIEEVSPTYDYTSFLDAIFDTVEGTRLCGSQSCPSKYPLNFNDSLPGQYYSVLPVGSTQALTGFYAFLSAAATALIVVGMDTLNLYAHQEGSDKPQLMASLRCVKEIFRDARMKLLAPMMFFIGLEQAFIYSDFGKVRRYSILILSCNFNLLSVVRGLYVGHTPSELGLSGHGVVTIDSSLYTEYAAEIHQEILHSWRWFYVPLLPDVGARPLEADRRRPCLILRDICSMGRMQRHLGDVRLHPPDLPIRHRQVGGGLRGDVILPPTGHRRGFPVPRLPMQLRQGVRADFLHVGGRGDVHLPGYQARKHQEIEEYLQVMTVHCVVVIQGILEEDR